MSNRNTEVHFSKNPTSIDIPRSRFDRSHTYKTTLNTGDLIPIFCEEIYPGDTMTMDMASVVRMATPIFPVMDNAYMDVYFFQVPNRLVWDHWREFMGENRQTHWEQPTQYQIPQVTAPAGGWTKGTLADYFGLPTQVEGISVSSLPFRAYGLIWNEWFRDENLQDPCMVNLDETTQTGSNGNDYVLDVQKGGMPAKAAKYHDYFTSALPAPQKGPAVMLPLGTLAPVWAGLTDNTQPSPSGASMHLKSSTTQASPAAMHILGTGRANTGTTAEELTSYTTGGTLNLQNPDSLYPANLYADLTQATGATINQLRQAFAVQRMYEKDARGGTRYVEMIRAHFGVTSPDGRQQRPEYLGGFRKKIGMDQVLQTSATDSVTPQGNTAAYSLTITNNSLFTKSFTEHSLVIGLMVIRTDHTYQQGINRMWSRKARTDFYFPSLANIGEQAILNKEIYAQGNAADTQAFGYQEAWADLRYHPSIVTGAMRSNYRTSLDFVHYADYYKEQPVLGSTWIQETRENMNRTIAVQDQLEDQFIADLFFKYNMARPMPLYSIPGLIDHH